VEESVGESVSEGTIVLEQRKQS